MLLMIGALSSGAVSSSWIWNLLTSVLIVTFDPCFQWIGGRVVSCRWRDEVRPRFTLCGLLTRRKSTLSKSPFQGVSRALRLPLSTSSQAPLVHRVRLSLPHG